ncbi:MAG: NHLP bacteriocin system secretion protein [Rhodospirillaceae bacterium]
MDKKIFREAALERLSTPEQLDQTMRVTRSAHWLAILCFFTIVFLACGWSVISGVSIKVYGQGILVTPQGILDVVSSSGGRILEFTVSEGQEVQVGDIVARIDQPDLRAELQARTDQLKDLEAQHQRIRAFHTRELASQAEYFAQKRKNQKQSIDFLEQRLGWLEERLGYEEELTQKQFIGRQRPIDTQIDINTAKENLATAANVLNQFDLEENNIRIAKEREILQGELELNSLSRQVAILSDRLKRETVVKSPYLGTVVEFKVNVGEIVGNGSSLFSVIPEESRSTGSGQTRDTDLVAVLYVGPEDGKKIIPGMQAQIDPATIKKEEYGFINGRVRQVSEIPSTPEGMMRVLKNTQLVEALSGEGAPFEVIIDLNPDSNTPTGFEWSSSVGPSTTINIGTLTQGSVIVRDVRLISLVIPALQNLFEAKQEV